MLRRFRVASCVVAAVALAGACSASLASAADESLGVRVPDGFEATLFADDDLAHDVYSLTIDAKGRVVVAGPGYVKILVDRDQDGKADEAKLLSEFPQSGAKGMLFDADGASLLVTGDGGLWKLVDSDGDDRVDGDPKRWAALATPEHGANGLTRGPDGWIYLVCGNNAGVDERLARTATSLIKRPRCGAIVRFSPDGETSEVIADGFRNPYDLTFAATGELFTVDSDGEREHCLPWYTPTRLFDVAIGREHGWLLGGWTKSWSRPRWFYDSVEWASAIGRGSPTGLETYRHRAFPDRYRHGVFSLCWTFGRVYFFPFERAGSSYRATPEIFLETVGDVGFAPVDLAVDPAGDLFVAIGGRGTRGGVFRVRAKRESPPTSLGDDPLARVLRADQPLASWSRAAWLPLAQRLGREPFERVVVDQRRPTAERIRALEVLVDVHGGASSTLFERDVAAAPPELAERYAWALSRSEADESQRQSLALLTRERDPRVRRAAWEAVARRPSSLYSPDFRAAIADADRRVYFAMIEAAAGSAAEAFDSWCERDFPALDRPRRLASPQEQLERLRRGESLPDVADPLEPAGSLDLTAKVALAREWVRLRREERSEKIDLAARRRRALTLVGEFDARALELAVADLKRLDATQQPDAATRDARRRTAEAVGHLRDEALERLRLVQILLGDFRAPDDQPEALAGYAAPRETIAALSAIERAELSRPLLAALATGDRLVDLEIARTLAMIGCEEPNAPETLAASLRVEDSPQDDVHRLACLARCPAPRSRLVTLATARVLAGLHDKHAAQKEFPRDNHPKHLAALAGLLIALDPALPRALVEDPKFGRAEHVIFASALPADARRLAIEKLFAAASVREAAGDEDAWSSELTTLVGELPADVTGGTLQRLFRDPALRDAAALALAKYARFEDRDRFVEALDSTQPLVVERAAETLATFPDPPTSDELGGAIVALQRLAATPGTDAAQTKLVRLLEKIAGTTTSDLAGGESIAGVQRARVWVEWLAKEEPEQARKRLSGSGDWPTRLEKIDWATGDVARGKAVFERKACHRCHTGSTRLGPDLAGAVKRSSRDDLFRAIYDPSREVSPTYQTLQIETTDGRTLVGLPVYVSPDGVLLQTGPDATVRVVGSDVASQRKSVVSLMPSGLLDGLADRDLADLAAYLGTLAK